MEDKNKKETTSITEQKVESVDKKDLSSDKIKDESEMEDSSGKLSTTGSGEVANRNYWI